jgi:hypothetical protein
MPVAVPLAIIAASVVGGVVSNVMANSNRPGGAPEGPKDMAAQETKTEQQTFLSETKRRQRLAQQNQLIKTSATGAKISEDKLGGPNLIAMVK